MESERLDPQRRRSRWKGRLAATAGLSLAAVVTSCGQRLGGGSSFLLVNALDAARGSDPQTFGGTLASDVVTIVDGTPTIFNDLGRVRLELALKDPGATGAPNTPTAANFITITQYRVRYVRTDGRNTQGVDVPYGFDGGMTATVGTGEVSASFTLVRTLAKDEAPLKALAVNGVIISTIAQVTFYGHDQTGREVSATANLSIDFGNFADKAGS